MGSSSGRRARPVRREDLGRLGRDVRYALLELPRIAGRRVAGVVGRLSGPGSVGSRGAEGSDGVGSGGADSVGRPGEGKSSSASGSNGGGSSGVRSRPPLSPTVRWIHVLSSVSAMIRLVAARGRDRRPRRARVVAGPAFAPVGGLPVRRPGRLQRVAAGAPDAGHSPAVDQDGGARLEHGLEGGGRPAAVAVVGDLGVDAEDDRGERLQVARDLDGLDVGRLGEGAPLVLVVGEQTRLPLDVAGGDGAAAAVEPGAAPETRWTVRVAEGGAESGVAEGAGGAGARAVDAVNGPGPGRRAAGGGRPWPPPCPWCPSPSGRRLRRSPRRRAALRRTARRARSAGYVWVSAQSSPACLRKTDGVVTICAAPRTDPQADDCPTPRLERVQETLYSHLRT